MLAFGRDRKNVYFCGSKKSYLAEKQMPMQRMVTVEHLAQWHQKYLNDYG